MKQLSETNYRNHPAFKKPENINSCIWRYMDFTKFASMLDKSGLFFSRLDRLEDVFEGSVPAPNFEVRREIEREHGMPEGKLNEFGPFLKWIRQWVYVNCWNMNETESAAMWKLYSKSNDSIAIRSTFGRLDECIGDRCYIGKVKYINYATETIPESILYYFFLHKRISFVHEQEIRALIAEFPSKVDFDFSNDSEGKLFETDLNQLIDRIYIDPTAPTWLLELTTSLCAKYGLKKEVKQSSLIGEPLY